LKKLRLFLTKVAKICIYAETLLTTVIYSCKHYSWLKAKSYLDFSNRVLVLHKFLVFWKL